MCQDYKDLYAALATFGATLQGIRSDDFADRGSFFRFGRDPNGVDFCPIFRVSILTRHGRGGLNA